MTEKIPCKRRIGINKVKLDHTKKSSQVSICKIYQSVPPALPALPRLPVSCKQPRTSDFPARQCFRLNHKSQDATCFEPTESGRFSLWPSLHPFLRANSFCFKRMRSIKRINRLYLDELSKFSSLWLQIGILRAKTEREICVLLSSLLIRSRFV